MGQKVSPIGLRVGIIRDWESKWYADKDFADLLLEDIRIREYVLKELKAAYVARVEIERVKNRVDVIAYLSRPGVAMGVNGENTQRLAKAITKLANNKKVDLRFVQLENPDLSAQLVARSIAEQLEQRASFRITQKRAIQKTMKAGAKGIKTLVSGRLGGTDIARSEGYSEGIVPLHTLRADIDYAWVEAATTYGRLGVKVWICRGEVLNGGMVKDPVAPRIPMRENRRNQYPRNNDRRPNTPKPEVKSESSEGGN